MRLVTVSFSLTVGLLACNGGDASSSLDAARPKRAKADALTVASAATSAPAVAATPTPQPVPAAPAPQAGSPVMISLCAKATADNTCRVPASSAFKACLAALPAGATLTVPPGCYRLDDSLVLTDQKKLKGNNQATLSFVNPNSGIDMAQLPNQSRVDGVILAYAPGSFDIYPFIIANVPAGDAIGLKMDGGNSVANYRLDLKGRAYDFFLKDSGNTLARAFTSWYVDGSGLYLEEEINGPNAVNELSVKTAPMQFAKRYTFIGDYVWSADQEYATSNTDDNPCRQVFPASGSTDAYRDQWTSVFDMSLQDLGGDLGQQQILILHQYDQTKPYVQGEYHTFARQLGDVGWQAKDANGQVTWGNAAGGCTSQATCPGGWASAFVWNKAGPAQPLDARYLCFSH